MVMIKKFTIIWTVACLILFSSLVTGFIKFYQAIQKDSFAEIIDISGSLRMLSKNIIKNVVLFELNQDTELIQKIKNDVTQFDNRLEKIKGITTNYSSDLNTINDVSISIHNLSSKWSSFKLRLHQLEQNHPKNIEYIIREEQQLLNASQHVVENLLRLKTSYTKQLVYNQIFYAIILAFVLFTIWYIVQYLFFKKYLKLEEEQRLLLNGSVSTLSKALEINDPYTYGHSERVSNLSIQIGKRLGYSQEKLSKLQLGCYLHDIGKVGVPKEILHKPATLTKEEFEQIKLHPTLGAEIISQINIFNELIEGVKHHHENYDGTGYPQGLKGEQIPEIARIISVADAFDAMTSDRPYRLAMKENDALKILFKNRGTQFDPMLVDVFLEIKNYATIQENEAS